MTMTEAAARLEGLAEALTNRPLGYGYATDSATVEAIAFAAAVLGMFVEALEEDG